MRLIWERMRRMNLAFELEAEIPMQCNLWRESLVLEVIADLLDKSQNSPTIIIYEL